MCIVIYIYTYIYIDMCLRILILRTYTIKLPVFTHVCARTHLCTPLSPHTHLGALQSAHTAYTAKKTRSPAPSLNDSITRSLSFSITDFLSIASSSPTH